MNIDSDALIARFARDFPAEFELVRLRVLVEAQGAEIQRLADLVPQSGYSPAIGRPYVQTGEDGHG